MILCQKRKIAIFLVPKTGTRSLCKLFKNVELEMNSYAHTNYKQFMAHYKDDNYEFFAFYRDPLDRFISGLRYVKRSKSRYPTLLHKYYGNSVKISCICSKEYNELDEEIKQKIEDIELDWFLKNWDFDTDLVFQKQINWLNYPKIQLLDFKKYDEEVLKLASKFNFIPSIVPKENVSLKLKNDFVSADVVNFVEKQYKEDYEFLELNNCI